MNKYLKYTFIILVSILFIFAITYTIYNILPTPVNEPFANTNTCGQGTKLINNQCVFDASDSVQLSNFFDSFKNNLVYDKQKQILFTNQKYNTQPNTVSYNYIQNWQIKGKYDSSKTLGPKCSCGDCATWRGGNYGTCNGSNINKTNKSNRVTCNTQQDPDACQCTYPYTPISGLCVTPWKVNPTNGKPCCSPCVYNGTCIGNELCDPSFPCQQNLVQFPGNRYICPNTPDDTTQLTQLELTPEQLTQCTLDNSTHLTNEYQCAATCTKSQIDCSKDCLPHLWKWIPITLPDNQSPGFIQTNQLVQFEPTEHITYFCDHYNTQCHTPSQPTSPLQNCTNCTNCHWEINTITNLYEYICDTCDTCTTDDTTCKNPTQCSMCQQINDNRFSPNIINVCSTCKNPTQCWKTTNPTERNAKPLPNIYNQGQNYQPENIKLEDTNSLSDSFISYRCRTNKGPNKATCSNYSNGITEGGALSFTGTLYNTNCTERGSCNTPITYLSNTGTCYGGLTPQQRGPQCDSITQTLPNTIEYTDEIKYGVATGISSQQCKEIFCKKFESGQWININDTHCDTICKPHLFPKHESIPIHSNTLQQIQYLTPKLA